MSKTGTLTVAGIEWKLERGAASLCQRAGGRGTVAAVAEHVEQLSRESRHPVFLLDESQLPKQEVLKHLHVPSNYDFDSKPLLSLVLVGLPDLWDILKARINRSLWLRIHCRIAISAATPADTAEYIPYRIAQAKSRKDLFASDAISVLHEGTLGHLRDLDRVATNAIKTAARRKLTTIALGGGKRGARPRQRQSRLKAPRKRMAIRTEWTSPPRRDGHRASGQRALSQRQHGSNGHRTRVRVRRV